MPVSVELPSDASWTTTLQSIGSFTLGSANDAATYTATDASLNRLIVGATTGLQLRSSAKGSDAGDIAVIDPTITLTAPTTLASARTR